MKHNLLKSVILSVILLMGVSNAWADDGDFYNTYLTYTFGATSGSAQDKDNGTGLSQDLGTLNSGSFKITAVYLKCWDDWGSNYKSSGGQMCYSKDGGVTQYLTGFSRSNKAYESNDYEWRNTNANLTIANSTDKSGSYTLTCWFQTWGWGDRFFPKSSGNYTFTYKIAPPSVKGFTVTPSGNKLSGSGTQNDPYIIKHNGSLTLTLSGSQNHTDANSTIQYNTSGTTWNTTKSRTISNITSTDVKNVTVKARYKNNSDANLCGAESSQTIYYRSEQVYTITFNANGHGTAPAAQTVSQGSKATQPAAPTATGYIFGGWYREAGCTNAFDFNTAINANITLYAKWTANKYTVTLDNQSATTAGTASVQATYGSAMPSATMPQKTGYTFGGYYTAINGGDTKYYNTNGSSAKNWDKTAATTLYAKWTATNYTITYNTNGGNSIAQKNYTIETATFDLPTPTRTGYTFAGWYDNANLTGNKVTQVAKGSTGNKTFYAAWTAMAPNTLYLRPVDFWPADNARFAVYAWNTSSNQWFDMADVGCVREYFKVDLPAEYSNFKFVRLNPETNNNNFNNDNAWNQTSDLTLSNEGNLYTTPRIYLRPSENWKIDGARFAAYFFQKDGETTSHECWMSMFSNDGGEVYWCNIPNHSHNYVIFCRMKPETIDNNFSNAWNQTGDLSILPEHNNNGNCFNMTGTEWETTGTWSTYWETYSPPTYTVTLEKTTYGKYAVELNGQKYYSSQSEDVVINNVPVESTLRLVSSESFNAAYNNNMCIQTHNGVDFEELNAEHRICGNTVIKENFTTLAAHTVYLRVPTSLGSWNTSGANYIYSHNNTANYVVVEASTPTDEEIYKESGYNYFKFVIPAGCRTFRFERKTAQDVAATNVTEEFTRYLPFEMTNCYTIKGIYSENIYYGSWGMSLANGDYRLLYVEQVVEKSNVGGNEWKTVVTRKKAHPSNIIKKGTASQIVSLHVYKERKYTANAGGGKTYESSSNPEIILQQYSNGGWVDKERHMVLGPLQTLPGMAMAPGRRNTAAATATLVYDDGIEVIKDDNEDGRVWNFTVTQDVNGVATLPLDGEKLVPYEGQYYIRTDNAEGGWMDYTIPDNHMHFSQYAKDNSNFSHYFCKWVETNIKPNTKFVIANDYGVAISDTLSEDQFTDLYGNIQENANIRWSWNETTNEITRAYIQGAYNGKAQNENILLDYTTDGTTDANDVILFDTGDWIYSIDVTVKVGSTLKSITATYPKITHTIDSKTINPIIQTFEEGLPMLTGGESANTYTVRVLYDFKIDKTLVALVPNEHKAEIAIDVMIERINQEKPATQVRADITYTNNQRSGEGSTVYAVMSFTKAHLTNEELSNEEKLTYWFSVPFNVTLSDVFGFGEVGQYWMIKYYDGEDRADKGLIDDNTFWKYITKKSTVLQANTGYVLALNKKVMDPNSPIFTNTNKISLYFPSTEPIQMIGTGYTVENCTIPSHTCTLQNREIYDSNWNFIGVPSYADKNITTNTTNVKYFYDYNHKTDKYTVTQNVNSKTFNSMFAYMVQFAGIINWESFTFNEGAQGLAAKRNTDSDAKQHNLRLELQQNGTTADKTFIQLQDEDATQMFDMNSDLCKIINAGSNIYSIINTESTPIQVAGNVLPIQETVIPLGVVISAAGEYTFAMPDGTDGIVVELIDYENNTRTNMLLDNYTVNLGKGTFENRFALHVQPSKVTTSVGEINTNTTGVKKYLIDGVLYMQKDGVFYDAQGHAIR